MPYIPGVPQTGMAQAVQGLMSAREARRGRQDRNRQLATQLAARGGGQVFQQAGDFLTNIIRQQMETEGRLDVADIRATAAQKQLQATLEANKPLRQAEERLRKLEADRLEKESAGFGTGLFGDLAKDQMTQYMLDLGTQAGLGDVARPRAARLEKDVQSPIQAVREAAKKELAALTSFPAAWEAVQDEFTNMPAPVGGFLAQRSPEEMAAILARAADAKQSTPGRWGIIVTELINRLSEAAPAGLMAYHQMIPGTTLLPQDVERLRQEWKTKPYYGQMPSYMRESPEVFEGVLEDERQRQAIMREILLQALNAYWDEPVTPLSEEAIEWALSQTLPEK